MNPFFEKYTTAFESIPFSKIKNEHFMPAFKKGIEEAENEIDSIVNNTEAPNFKNTIAALSTGGELLTKTSKAFYNLTSANTSKEIQKIAQEVSPLHTKLRNDQVLNEALFQKIATVYKNKDKENLSFEQEKLLTDQYKYYVRNGANLNSEDKNTLREIDTELAKASLQFGENVLEAMNGYEMHLTDEKDLSGLPEGSVEAARNMAKEKNKEGWIFTLDGPSYIGFMSYSDNRELRKKLHKANNTKNSSGNKIDNREIVKKIVALRFKRANLLGYKTHADFVLEESMATSVHKVEGFLNELLEKAKPFAIQEYKDLCAFSVKNGGPKELFPYDSSYYVQKLRKQLFNLDDEMLKPYFKLENVIKGSFIVAEKLYGLRFEEIHNVDKYHPDVKTYKVTDENGEYVALFYADYFPRESKQNGAWMNSLKSQFTKDGVNSRPHIINVCNFTKPTDTKPSLLTFREVQTLFHEFGHGLHGMLSNVEFENLAGTSVYRDFVELPSQVLENWCDEEECLNLFAFHYETGETIPKEYIQKIKESANFREASGILRQLEFGMLDMAYHHINPSEIQDVKAFEKEYTKQVVISPREDYSCFSTSFSHIFAGGYSAGYYSYKWAEVLDADAFEVFKEKGIFNREVGEKFKECILSKGGTKHPMELYKDFRGSEPDNTALLKRAGLLEMVKD